MAQAKDEYSTSSQIQLLINQAVANGQVSLQLPDHTIYVTSTIIVPIGTNNLTIQGGPNTRLVRGTPADITLLRVGDDYTFAMDNAQLPILFQGYDILPAAEGQEYVDLVGGAQLPTGYVLLAGVDPAADYVRHATNVTTFWYKRELTKIIGQTGRRLHLNRGLGRDFEYARLYFAQADSATSEQKVTRNIHLKDIALDGEYEIPPFRVPPTARVQYGGRGVVLGTCDNCTLDNVSVSNVRNDGILVKMSRYITLNDCSVQNMVGGFRYGIEIAGSRTVTVNRPNFEGVGLGVVFNSGSMDGMVADAIIPEGQGGHDIGHGTGEKRLTFTRCVADEFILANAMWRAGVNGINLYDCSSRRLMSVHGGADNVLISGKHPNESRTGKAMYIFTQGGGNPFPPGISFVRNLRVNYAKFENDQNSGQALLMNASAPGQIEIGDWIFDRCQFINPRTGSQNGGAAVDLIASQSLVSSILFDNCLIQNSNGYQPPVRYGPNTGLGLWNVRFQGCTFVNPIAGGLYDTHAVRISAPSAGLFVFAGNAFNSAQLDPSDVVNDGIAVVLFE